MKDNLSYLPVSARKRTNGGNYEVTFYIPWM